MAESSVTTKKPVKLGSVVEEWERFKEQFDRKYDSLEEEAKRRSIFEKNYLKVVTQNELYEKGESTWHAGINQFADKEPHEMGCCGVRKKE